MRNPSTLPVWIAVILIALGILSFVVHAAVAIFLIGAGWLCLDRASLAQRQDAQNIFWGICLICMVIVAVVTMFRTIF